MTGKCHHAELMALNQLSCTHYLDNKTEVRSK